MDDTFDFLCEQVPELAPCLPKLERAFDLLSRAFREGGKLLVCGNGGSAADSEHIVGELMKGFDRRRALSRTEREHLHALYAREGRYLAEHLQGALPAISLTSQTSLITAVANDTAAEMVFAQQVYGYGRPGDVLLAISTSGNSRNVLHALRVARAAGVATVGLTGPGGGEMAALCDVALCVPPGATRPGDTAEIQRAHQALYHALCRKLEEEFFSR
ncbi:MAG: SIS domain-containing protein [Anaerolineae bacterium]|nr:SIS domain-containing protein [Anaerolineae bacterium]